MSKQRTAVVAVVTLQANRVQGGGLPIFIAQHEQELQQLSGSLEKILDASAHEITPDTIIMVSH